jgi:hypothetical protein
MFKYVRYGLAIAALMLPLFAQAELTGINEIDRCSKNVKTCDATITSPTFLASYCNGQTQLGLYTVRNNTPVRILIQRIEIVRRDTLLPIQTAILTSPVNNCTVGTYLAPGASCNVLINVSSLAVQGAFNRFLRVYINTRQVKVDSSPITSITTGVSCPGGGGPVPPVPPIPVVPPVIPPPPPPPPLAGICPLYEFAVLAASTVTNTGPTVVNGDLGVSPGTAVTGFPPGVVTGTTYIGVGSLAGAAQAQATIRYNQLAGLACNVNLTGQNLGGLVLAPGVYCFNTSAQLTGTLTLNGLGDPNATFIFQIGSTITTASNSAVVLIGGAASNNVNWQIGSAATLGTDTAFQGNIYALSSITMNSGTTLQGRAIALTGAVTLDSNAVNRLDVCP